MIYSVTWLHPGRGLGFPKLLCSLCLAQRGYGHTHNVIFLQEVGLLDLASCLQQCLSTLYVQNALCIQGLGVSIIELSLKLFALLNHLKEVFCLVFVFSFCAVCKSGLGLSIFLYSYPSSVAFLYPISGLPPRLLSV